MKQRILALTLLLIMVGAPGAHSQNANNTMWHWIWLEPDHNNGWKTFDGVAPVELKGRRFEVTLHGVGPDEQPSLNLVGIIVGKKVTAIGTLLGTDATPWRYSGVMEQGRTKLTDASHGRGFDRIVLMHGPAFVGLYRGVQPTR